MGKLGPLLGAAALGTALGGVVGSRAGRRQDQQAGERGVPPSTSARSAAVPVSEEAPLRTRVGVIVVGDVAHVVVHIVVDGEHVPGHPPQLVVHVLEVLGGRLGAVEAPHDHRHVSRSRTPRSSRCRLRGTTA